MPGENLAAFLEPRLECCRLSLRATGGARFTLRGDRLIAAGIEACASFDERGETRQPVAGFTLGL